MAKARPPQKYMEIAEVVAPLAARLSYNLGRVRHLVATYQRLYGKGRGRRTVAQTDLLRAAVVFLHATLEDSLRTVAGIYLPSASTEALDEVPLAGSTASRAENFRLGRLVKHRGKTVDELIVESISEHLRRSSYNDTNDIMALLKKLDLPPVDEVTRTLPDLQELMRRRHQIVHQADRVDTKGRGMQRAASIGTQAVERWTAAVSDFGQALMAHVIHREHTRKFGDLDELRKKVERMEALQAEITSIQKTVAHVSVT